MFITYVFNPEYDKLLIPGIPDVPEGLRTGQGGSGYRYLAATGITDGRDN